LSRAAAGTLLIDSLGRRVTAERLASWVGVHLLVLVRLLDDLLLLLWCRLLLLGLRELRGRRVPVLDFEQTISLKKGDVQRTA
jgi:hypothetical protein